MPTAVQGIAKKAASQQGDRFRHLYGRLDEDVMNQCWRDSRQDAAAGVDQGSAQAYAQHLDEHIPRLVERLQQQRDRATLVSRHDMPTGDGTPRPLGIPAVEDTRLQRAVTRLLDAIDAQDFLRCRNGYRPHVGALEAVDTRTITRPFGRDAWVVEVDIKTFCETIDPDGMVRI
jgi:retron-type reverse transcriptase